MKLKFKLSLMVIAVIAVIVTVIAALLLREGNGGVVNASRSILRAWSVSDGGESTRLREKAATNTFAAEAARRAAVEMRDAIKAAIH